MICNPDTLMCEIPIGALAVVIALACMGISVMLYDVAEGIQEQWNKWMEATENKSVSWRIKFGFAWILHVLRYAHEDDGAAQYCYFCGHHLSRRWPLDRFVT